MKLTALFMNISLPTLGVTSNSLHPGAVATEIFLKEDSSSGWLGKLAKKILNLSVKLVGKVRLLD